MSLILGGYVLQMNGDRRQFPSINDPVDSEIESFLQSIRGSSGVLALRKSPPPTFGFQEVVCKIEDGKCALMLNEVTPSGDIEVHTFTRGNVQKSPYTSVLGEMHPSSSVIEDFDVVYAALKEFKHSGSINFTGAYPQTVSIESPHKSLQKGPIGKGPHMKERDYYIDYDFEEVMFHWEHTNSQVFQKFYGREDESLVPHTARLFNEALLSGVEITSVEYVHGKPRR